MMIFQGTARSFLMPVALFALGLGSILGYTYARRADAPAAPEAVLDTPAVSPLAQRAATPTATATDEPSPSPPVAEAPPAEQFPPDAELLSAALGQDVAKGEAAVRTLAKMPRERAMPILRQIVASGDERRRVLALHSLRTVAQDQGDADGGIREVIRTAIYHGDSEDVTAEAQNVLNEVESAVAAAKPRR